MWKPSKDQEQYLKLVMSMTADCLIGNGVDTVDTYKDNLMRICNNMPQPINPADPKSRAC